MGFSYAEIFFGYNINRTSKIKTPITMPQSPITLDDIYALFRVSEQQRQEYQREFQEYQREFQERQLIVEQEVQALRDQIAATDRQIEKTDRQIAETNKQMGGITRRWGEFVENLIKPAAAKLFREQGIEVHLTALRVEGADQKGSIEIDILVENTNEVVAIEVKSHLEVRDVKRFLQTLERFKHAFPKYQNYKLYGAVAGIKIDERSDVYATQEGLYVIEPAGDSVIIANSENLEPRIW
jgi:hypothetical protein